jgi:hypothetical protein
MRFEALLITGFMAMDSAYRTNHKIVNKPIAFVTNMMADGFVEYKRGACQTASLAKHLNGGPATEVWVFKLEA